MTITDRIADLSTIWKQATIVFPYLDRLKFNWDDLYREYLTRALETDDEREYHLLMAEFMQQLGDGHTGYYFSRDFMKREGMLPFSLKYCADGYYISEIEGAQARYLYGKVESINGIAFQDILQEAFRYIYHVGDYAPSFSLHRILPLLLRQQGNVMVTSKGTFCFDLKVKGENRTTQESRESVVATAAPQVSYAYETLNIGKLDVRLYHIETDPNDSPAKILYIKLDNFLYSRAAEEVSAAIRKAVEASNSNRGIILDLRENIGGMTKFGADVAELLISGEFHGCQKWTQSMRGIDIACASQFLEMSEAELEANLAAGLGTREEVEECLRIGRHCHYEEYQDTYGAPDHVALTDLPCVILTSRDTISAAEDFVAMFRSNHRATIMGTPTSGTTGTPMLLPLACGGRARICSVGYRLLDGTEFIGVGIQPDIIVNTYLKDLEQGMDVVQKQAIDYLIHGPRSNSTDSDTI